MRTYTARSVCLICSHVSSASDISAQLDQAFRTTTVTFEGISAVRWNDHEAIIIDAGQKTANDVGDIGELLGLLSHLGKPIFLAVGASMRTLFARTGLLAGVNAFTRPVNDDSFVPILSALLSQTESRSLRRAATREVFAQIPEHSEALLAADEALERIFEVSLRGNRLDMPTIDKDAGTIIESLGESGIASWISGVRQHHDSTFQHCLLVTGTAIAFGHQLGFRRGDLRRIALGALMHDIGKSRIPVGILDKPSELTLEERALIRRHPELGLTTLAQQPSAPAEISEIVLNHHEYLDGSGYPNGLEAANISDVVRLVTIADVFSALIEKRAYRAPMRGVDAYEELLRMDGKLDMAIVRAVRHTAFKAEG